MTWKVNYRIYRSATDGKPAHYDTYPIEIGPEETVLDGVERIWARQDRSLLFRHACHHASCGSCGMRVNGVEKLSCVTYLKDVTKDGGTITVDPLRHFPQIGDLVVDVTPMFAKLQQIKMPITQRATALGEPGEYNRFEDCIECGLCISACPMTQTNPNYLGPAALAAAERLVVEPRGADVSAILKLVDTEDGCWRCHTAFECSEVCPYQVDPAGKIMALRRQLMIEKVKGLFGLGALRPARGGII